VSPGLGVSVSDKGKIRMAMQSSSYSRFGLRRPPQRASAGDVFFSYFQSLVGSHRRFSTPPLWTPSGQRYRASITAICRPDGRVREDPPPPGSGTTEAGRQTIDSRAIRSAREARPNNVEGAFRVLMLAPMSHEFLLAKPLLGCRSPDRTSVKLWPAAAVLRKTKLVSCSPS